MVRTELKRAHHTRSQSRSREPSGSATEIGMIGASSLARDGRKYDVGFIIDNGLAGDIPTGAEAHMPVELGGGPALVHRDSSVHYSRRLIARKEADWRGR